MLRLLSIISLLLLISISDLQAQQKIAYIDSEFILSKIPEYANVGERLKVISQEWKLEIGEREKEIQDLEQDFEAKSILYSSEERDKKAKEIEAKKQQLLQYRNSKYGPTGELINRQKELLEPIQQRILEAVNKIAQRDGYDFIFDRTGDYLVIFTNPKWNVSSDVLLELGIEVDELGN